MATVIPTPVRELELRLADQDLEVAHAAGPGGRYTVEVALEGPDLLELQNVLTPRLATIGVDRVSRVGTTLSLYGVEAGREHEVFEVLRTAIADVNELRQTVRDDREQSRSASEDAAAVREADLEAVKQSFRTARNGAPAGTDLTA